MRKANGNQTGQNKNRTAAQATEKSSGKMKNRIAEAAYYKAQSRDFAPGYELQDWLEAENELSNKAGKQ